MAYNVLDIAKKIIAKTDDEHGDTISNLKLQKMLYYMQGFHLAFFETPLFDDDIVAWQYGPVVPCVFYEFKKYKSGAINVSKYEDHLKLTDDEQTVFDNVYRAYGQFSAVALMNRTHDESPWKTTNINDIITQDKMSSYFKTQIED